MWLYELVAELGQKTTFLVSFCFLVSSPALGTYQMHLNWYRPTLINMSIDKYT